MKPEYDFSKRKPPAPAPRGASKRRTSSKTGLAVAAVLIIALAGLAYWLVNRDSGTAATPSADFCQVSTQLSQALSLAGVPVVGPIPDGIPPDKVKGALDSVQGLDGWERSAPSSVRDDVRSMVAGLRAAATGNLNAARTKEFTEAEARVAQASLGQSGCPQTGSGSEGD